MPAVVTSTTVDVIVSSGAVSDFGHSSVEVHRAEADDASSPRQHELVVDPAGLSSCSVITTVVESSPISAAVSVMAAVDNQPSSSQDVII